MSAVLLLRLAGPMQSWGTRRRFSNRDTGAEPARLMRDYHTAQEVRRASGTSTQDTVVSERFYLADADFLVGLQGSDRSSTPWPPRCGPPSGSSASAGRRSSRRSRCARASPPANFTTTTAR